jgi:hypothetical protein
LLYVNQAIRLQMESFLCIHGTQEEHGSELIVRHLCGCASLCLIAPDKSNWKCIRARPRRGYHNHQQPQQTKQSSFDHVVFICASFTRLMEWQSFIVSAIVPAGIGGIRSTDGSWICCTGQCLATHLSGGWPWPRAAGLPICVPGAGLAILFSQNDLISAFS